MTRKKVWKSILFISYLFIFAGGINTGFSKFLMAIPFVIIAITVSFTIIKNSRINIFTTLVIAVSILLSTTLEKNSLVYPILNDGFVEILQDGVHTNFYDGSNEMYDKRLDIPNLIPTYIELKKGEQYKVIGLSVNYPAFIRSIKLETEIGDFSYPGDPNYPPLIKTNKTVQSKWPETVNYLMNWPILFIEFSPISFYIFGALLFLLVMYMRQLPLPDNKLNK